MESQYSIERTIRENLSNQFIIFKPVNNNSLLIPFNLVLLSKSNCDVLLLVSIKTETSNQDNLTSNNFSSILNYHNILITNKNYWKFIEICKNQNFDELHNFALRDVKVYKDSIIPKNDADKLKKTKLPKTKKERAPKDSAKINNSNNGKKSKKRN